MRPRTFRSSSLALLLGLGALLTGATASAQPCCAGASILTPARLTLHEDALLGVQVRAGDVIGAFDPNRAFTASPSGTSEYDFEQDLVGTLRFLEHAQATLTLPLLETFLQGSGPSEVNAGLGDVALSGRWDFLLAGESTRWPGIAALAGVSFPTGRVDVTGTGAVQGTVGLALEQTWRHLFLNATGLLTQSTPRQVMTSAGPGTETLGLQGSVSGAVGWGFDAGPALALVVAFTASRDATGAGSLSDIGPNSARAKTIVGLGGAMPLSDTWRIQGTLTGQIPLSGLGKNEPSSFAVSVLVMRTWS